MNSKKEALSKAKLYLVLNGEGGLYHPPEIIAKEAIAGGADVVQLRCKGWSKDKILPLAKRLAKIINETKALFIINDHTDIAIDCKADGVHLGQDDGEIQSARDLLGDERLIGRSTHSVEQALNAQEEGADYIGFGPLFATPTKPDYVQIGPELIAGISERIQLPFFAIGGIDMVTLPQVLKAGAARIAVVRAIADTKEIRRETIKMKEALL